MADTVTSQLLFKGNRHTVWRFTNVSDGTGETDVTKIDATSAGQLGTVVQGQTFYPGVHLKITKIIYDCKGMGLRIQWHATTNEDIVVLGGFGTQDYRDIGGIQNPGTTALTGSTGSIDFTTINAALNATYSVEIHCTLGVPQS